MSPANRPRIQNLFLLTASGFLAIWPPRGPCCAEELASVPSALITIIDTVEVAAASPGILQLVPAREGVFVEQGQLLARVDDRAATLKANQAEFQLTLAQQEAVNDIAVRLATKTHEVAVQELKRAQRINQKLPNSVSAVEVALKQLASDRTALELENAKYQQRQAKITSQIRAAEFSLAQHEVRKHGVFSPIDGMIVHVEKRAGEYVELGAAIARVVRVDRVRAEGFAPASFTAKGLLGRRATLQILLDGRSTEVEGKVVFVSPEADPVNQEVPIWAEFGNPELLLKPGLRGRMIIHTEIAAVAANQAAAPLAQPSHPPGPQP